MQAVHVGGNSKQLKGGESMFAELIAGKMDFGTAAVAPGKCSPTGECPGAGVQLMGTCANPGNQPQ